MWYKPLIPKPLRWLFNLSSVLVNKCNIRPPQPAADRHGLAAVLIVRNEKNYLDEWIDFHRKAGVRHFFIYDDLSTDGTADHLKKQYSPEILTVIPWHINAAAGKTGLWIGRQALAYSHAVGTFGSEFRWMMFIDADEFVFPKKSATLMEALEPLKAYSNISLPMVMFGFNDHEHPPSGGVVRNYLRCTADRFTADKAIINFKCIVDPCKINRVGVHQFATSDMGECTVNDQGMRYHANKWRRKRGSLSCENIQLNHYYTRSKQDLAKRLARGAVSMYPKSKYERDLMSNIELIERAAVEDLAAVNWYTKRQIETNAKRLTE
ncbi:MAG: glycosyltransferase family 2 protein [Cellvibrionales bacterium]|nr:glycosyltransferase family 2 protein [Cellvibrionales bacterium]